MADINPYQLPDTPPPPPTAGGNLADAVAGRYDFEIGEVLSEAWTKIEGTKLIFGLGGLLVFGAMLVITLILSWLIPGLHEAATVTGGLQQLLGKLIVSAMIYPFFVGFMMLGVRRAADLPIEFQMAFSYLGIAPQIIVAALIMTALASLGFLLFFLPGVYLTVAYVFALPLIAEKGLTPWVALETSRKAVTTHWFKIAGVLLLFSLILVISGFTIVGLIWTIPLYIIGIGILYRIIFGIEEQQRPASI